MVPLTMLLANIEQIAELLAEYKAEEAPAPVPLTPSRLPLLERNVNINAAQQPRQHPADVYLDTEEVGGHVDQENLTPEDDSTSLSSYTPSSADLTNPFRKLTKAENRQAKKAKKSTKSTTKALRNQSRHLASITLADVDHVATILHGDTANDDARSAHPLATDRTIEDVINRNLAFVGSIQAHKAYLFKSVSVGRKEHKERKRQKKRESKGEQTEDSIEMDEVVSAILIKLGVSPAIAAASLGNSSPALAVVTRNTPGGFGRKRTNSAASPAGTNKNAVAIAAKLRQAVKIDLEKHENEIHARYVRAGGFWRYVGKAVFERMTDIARDMDVSTGERWEKKFAREERAVVENENVNGEDIAA